MPTTTKHLQSSNSRAVLMANSSINEAAMIGGGAAAEYKRRLELCTDGNMNILDPKIASAILDELENYSISIEELTYTRLGRYINLLRKNTRDAQLAKKAKFLVKKWQSLLPPVQSSANSHPKDQMNLNASAAPQAASNVKLKKCEPQNNNNNTTATTNKNPNPNTKNITNKINTTPIQKSPPPNNYISNKENLAKMPKIESPSPHIEISEHSNDSLHSSISNQYNSSLSNLNAPNNPNKSTLLLEKSNAKKILSKINQRNIKKMKKLSANTIALTEAASVQLIDPNIFNAPNEKVMINPELLKFCVLPYCDDFLDV